MSKFTIKILYFYQTICRSLHINNPTFFHCEICVTKLKCNWTLLNEYLIHHPYTLQFNSHALSTFWFTMLTAKDLKFKVKEKPYFHCMLIMHIPMYYKFQGLLNFLQPILSFWHYSSLHITYAIKAPVQPHFIKFFYINRL